MKKALTTIIMLNIFTLSACNNLEDISNRPNPVITITVAGYQEPIVIELYYDVAPNTVNNFVNLVQSGYFDGVIFHRVISGFMIQGGQGSPLSCKIQGEFTSNDFTNNLLHERGVISMARTNDPDSATGQFFIVHQASPHLDENYAAFGRMTSGFATLDAIAAVNTGAQDKPIVDVVMTSVTVETGGYSYKKPICRGY